jgi:hypothetical protein
VRRSDVDDVLRAELGNFRNTNVFIVLMQEHTPYSICTQIIYIRKIYLTIRFLNE